MSDFGRSEDSRQFRKRGSDLPTSEIRNPKSVFPAAAILHEYAGCYRKKDTRGILFPYFGSLRPRCPNCHRAAKNPAFGELAVPIAFQLAKDLKRPPKQIAAELVGDLGQIEGVSALEMAGNGYINVRLNRSLVALSLFSPATSAASRNDGKIIVEHTNINPNKAAHIGHLRNAILGDTFVRMLRSEAIQSKCRITLTTRVSRWPTSWRGSITSKRSLSRK